jgi:hypothetical protein
MKIHYYHNLVVVISFPLFSCNKSFIHVCTISLVFHMVVMHQLYKNCVEMIQTYEQYVLCKHGMNL